MKKAAIVALLGLTIFLAAVAAYYTSEVITARRETPAIVERILASDRIKLQLEDVTPERLDMLLKVQDRAFYHHNGVDLRTPGAGLTTVTQGLVKLLYFDRYRPGLANKLRQTLIARFALDPLVSKDTQLLLFVNLAYLGRHEGEQIWGFGNAAEVYFGKSLPDLTDDEYLALVAMLIGPNDHHIIRQPARNAERVERIKSMLSGEYEPKGLMDLRYDLDSET